MTRTRLPNERNALTQRFVIGDEFKGYVTAGFYDDGTVGEIFVKMDSQGSTVSGFVDAWAIAVSMLLQMGMPLADICTKFKGMSFPPAGFTNNPEIRQAKSPIDYVVRWLEKRFVEKDAVNGIPSATLPAQLAEMMKRLDGSEKIEATFIGPKCEQCGAKGVPVAVSRGLRRCAPCRDGRKPL